MCIENAKKVKKLPKTAYKLMLVSDGKLRGSVYNQRFIPHVWNRATSEKCKCDSNLHEGRIQVLGCSLKELREDLDWQFDEIWECELKGAGYVGVQPAQDRSRKPLLSYLVDEIKPIKCILTRGDLMKYKIGETVLVKKEVHGTSLVRGDEVTITHYREKENNRECYEAKVVKSKTDRIGAAYCVYDYEIQPIAHERRIELLESELSKKQKEIAEIKKQIDFLKNYEDDEDYVAAKILKLVKAGKGRKEIHALLKKSK